MAESICFKKTLELNICKHPKYFEHSYVSEMDAYDTTIRYLSDGTEIACVNYLLSDRF